jgi:hypothetical protein
MKKIIPLILLLALPLSAQAYFIGGGATDVGLEDTLIGVAPKAGNPTAEEAWIETFTGDLDYVTKIEDLVGTYADGFPNILVADISPGSDYYVFKNAAYMAAFENVEELAWAVIDVAQPVSLPPESTARVLSLTFGDLFNFDNGQIEISHITLLDGSGGGGGGGNQIPVPAPLVLMSLGILGLGFTRRFLT